MRDSTERDLAVADTLGEMADARIKELEAENAALREQLAENARNHFDDARDLETRLEELQNTTINCVTDAKGPRVEILCRDFQHAQRLQQALGVARAAPSPSSPVPAEQKIDVCVKCGHYKFRSQETGNCREVLNWYDDTLCGCKCEFPAATPTPVEQEQE